MQKIKLIETFETNNSINLVDETKLSESKVAKSRVDGKYIIGMIEGQFFKPDGMSRNQRWYPRSLWEKALNTADVKNRLATSTMFGEIGHSDGPVEDLTLRNGCASHFIDDLWIDDKGHGMGRAYILNTPTGQLLKTYLGAGCKLKVSTRGEGLYKEGYTHDGCPVVDDDSYELQTADFVINPGFLETSAHLKESYEKVSEEIKQNKKTIEETIAHVKKEGEFRMDLNIDAYVSDLKEQLKESKSEIKSLREELKAKDKELLEKQFNESAEVKSLKEDLEPFKKLKVSAKTLNETLKRSQDLLKKEKAEKAKISEELESYKSKCGSIKEVEEATKLSTKSLKIIEEYRKIGTPEEIKKMVEGAEKAVKELAETEKLEVAIKKLMKEVNEARALKKSCKKAKIALEAYRTKYGSLKAVNEAKEVKVEEKVEKKVTNEALEVSKKYGCTVESAAKLVNKHGLEKASQLLESALAKKSEVKPVLEEGKKLVEEVAQLDKVTSVPAEKTANDFLKPGMIKNYFNQQALGKEVTYDSINTIDGTKPNKAAASKELLKKYTDKIEVEKAPEGLKKEITPAEAEAEAKKLLK